MAEENTKIEHSQILSSNFEDFDRLKDITTLVYVLQAVQVLMIPTSIIAIIINYVKRSDVAGSLLDSHFKWQMRTFWWALLWFAIASFFIFIIIGIPLGYPMLAVLYLWWIYRIVRGWVNLNKNQPMYSS